MKIFTAVIALVLFLSAVVRAETTNTLSDAEIQGRALAQNFLTRQPPGNFTNSGILKIFQNGKRTNLLLTVTTDVRIDSYQVCYATRTNSDSAPLEWLKIIHGEHGNIYYTSQPLAGGIESGVYDARLIRGNQAMISFAASDFWLFDLGLEFLHWPQQKILKKEPRLMGPAFVLESTNPNPGTNGYSRVVSSIDVDSLVLIEAYAYDPSGKKLKIFYPKDIKKVNGQWQVQTLVMENLQTGSKSRIEFDLKK